jgi:DNA-binding MarR family transcriptional regulator
VPTTRDSSTANAPSSAGDDIDRLRSVLLRLARCIRTSSVGDITPSQLAVLASIARHGPLTVREVAETERMKPPSASKIIAALEQLGLVERTVDPDDRRCTPIATTPTGVDYLKQVRTAGRTWLARQLHEIDQQDVAMIHAAVPALERLLGSTA